MCHVSLPHSFKLVFFSCFSKEWNMEMGFSPCVEDVSLCRSNISSTPHYRVVCVDVLGLPMFFHLVLCLGAWWNWENLDQRLLNNYSHLLSCRSISSFSASIKSNSLLCLLLAFQIGCMEVLVANSWPHTVAGLPMALHLGLLNVYA